MFTNVSKHSQTYAQHGNWIGFTFALCCFAQSTFIHNKITIPCVHKYVSFSVLCKHMFAFPRLLLIVFCWCLQHRGELKFSANSQLPTSNTQLQPGTQMQTPNFRPPLGGSLPWTAAAAVACASFGKCVCGEHTWHGQRVLALTTPSLWRKVWKNFLITTLRIYFLL